MCRNSAVITAFYVMLSIVSESYGLGWENTSYVTEILELFLEKFNHKNLAMMQKIKVCATLSTKFVVQGLNSHISLSFVINYIE